MVSEVNLSQPPNATSPILLSEVGIFTDFRLLQRVNVRSSKVLILFESLTVVRQTQPKNAQLPILVTLSPITTVSK